MWDLASKNGSLGVGVLKKEVLKVTSESGFNLSSLLPVCSHWVNSTTSYCCHDPRHLCHHAFPTIMDCTSFFWFLCQVKVSKVINTLFISIICNRTQNGKSTEETKGRPGISDSGTGCEVQDRCLGEGQWLWRYHFRVGKDRTPISGTKEQVKRQEDRDQSELSQAHACQTGSRAHEEGNQGCGKRARQGDLGSRSKKSSKMPLTSVTKYPCSVGKPSDPSLFLAEKQRVL